VGSGPPVQTILPSYPQIDVVFANAKSLAVGDGAQLTLQLSDCGVSRSVNV